MKIDKLKSTIIIGVFMIISLLFVIWLIPFNLKETVEAYANSVNESDVSIDGEMILLFQGIASIGLFAIIISAYIPAFLCLIISSISFIFSLKNRKSTTKSIRVINYFYDIILIMIMLFSLIKIFLFASNIA